MSLGPLVAWLVAAGLFLIGLCAVPFPALMSRAYGAPVDDPAGFTLVRAMGLRDVALGAALLALLLKSNLDGVAVVLAVTGALSLVDFALVVAFQRRLIPQLVVHASGFVLCAVGVGLLTRGV
jgi:hypothetical protein